jgi:hypothetical protein
MHSLKPLKSVAHNLAHHFASTLNYWEDDYAINHLYKTAKRFQSSVVIIDVLAQTATPKNIQVGMVAEIIPKLKDTFFQLLVKEGFSLDIVSTVILEYNFNVPRVDYLYQQPTYDCISTITTRDGHAYMAQLTEKNN